MEWDGCDRCNNYLLSRTLYTYLRSDGKSYLHCKHCKNYLNLFNIFPCPDCGIEVKTRNLSRHRTSKRCKQLADKINERAVIEKEYQERLRCSRHQSEHQSEHKSEHQSELHHFSSVCKIQVDVLKNDVLKNDGFQKSCFRDEFLEVFNMCRMRVIV